MASSNDPYVDIAADTKSQSGLNADSQVDPTTVPIDPTVKPEDDQAADPSRPVHAGNAATSIPSPAPVDFTKSPPKLPTPPFVTIEGVPNFRDLGGYACLPPPSHASSTQSWRVKPHLIYRCATLSQITIPGSDTLTSDLGVTTLYDLRSTPETTRIGAVPEIPSLTRHFTPVYETEDYSPEVLAKKYSWYTAPPDSTYTYTPQQPPLSSSTSSPKTVRYSSGFISAYRDIATFAARGSKAAYRTILSHILNDPAPSQSTTGTNNIQPFVFHCTAGKDRTGVLAAIILSLCRVPEDVIVWEYSITEPGLGGWRDEIIARMMRGGMSSNTNHQQQQSGNTGGAQSSMTRAEAERICGSKAANMRVWLREVLQKEFGGPEGYLTKMCGFTANQVTNIRENLVEQAEGCGVRTLEGWDGNEDFVTDHENTRKGGDEDEDVGGDQEAGKMGLAVDSSGRDREEKVMAG